MTMRLLPVGFAKALMAYEARHMDWVRKAMQGHG
jgi:hypothetical protein